LLADAQTTQYREGLTMSDDEVEFIEHVLAEFNDENSPDADEE